MGVRRACALCAASRSAIVRASRCCPRRTSTMAPLGHDGYAPIKDTIQDLEKGAGALPALTRVNLSWHDLVVQHEVTTSKWGLTVGAPTQTVQVLRGVSGVARGGELLAIMGPSGAGKTSLLDVLAGRQPTQSGTIALNGQVCVGTTVRQLSVYVMQDDVLLNTLTSREYMNFSATLRLRHLTQEQRDARVHSLLMQLGLLRCADTRVGDLSGGERKRTAIAVELVTDPRVMFLDEPTSGLDSFTALSVIRMIKRLASEGRTVITTIHQPSAEIVAEFSRLHLLARGQTVFAGPPNEAIAHFARLGFPCPTYTNPSDFFMQVLYDGPAIDGDGSEQPDAPKALPVLLASPLELDGLSEQPTYGGEIIDRLQREAEQSLQRASLWVSMWAIIVRSLRHFLREPMSLRLRFGQALFTGILLGSIFFDIGTSQSSIQDRIGVIFCVMTLAIMGTMMPVLLTFPQERRLFLREHSNGMYSVGAYYAGKASSEIPFLLLIPLVLSVLIYFMVGLTMVDATRFWIFYFVLTLLCMASHGMGLMLGCLVPDMMGAVALGPMVMTPMMLFAGLFVNLDNVPAVLSWMQYLSLFKWGMEAIAINEFTDLELYCEPDEQIGPLCPITRGEQILVRLGMDPDDFWHDVAILAGMLVAVHAVAVLLLYRQTRGKKERGI